MASTRSRRLQPDGWPPADAVVWWERISRPVSHHQRGARKSASSYFLDPCFFAEFVVNALRWGVSMVSTPGVKPRGAASSILARSNPKSWIRPRGVISLSGVSRLCHTIARRSKERLVAFLNRTAGYFECYLEDARSDDFVEAYYRITSGSQTCAGRLCLPHRYATRRMHCAFRFRSPRRSRPVLRS